ncbi:MAG: type II secretion system protein, partial [Gammaproteobacteria bacterium]|nr:type II secretion system protein [Gammaproteobacteria bacterium]
MNNGKSFGLNASNNMDPSVLYGFSLLELIVVIALISTLIGVAVTRLLPYIDEAERVAVLRVEGQLRSSITMEAAKRIVRGQSASLSDLEG